MASSAVNGTNSKRTRFLDHIKFVHLFAGVSGGIISTLALHPLDLIKVRFQVDEKLGRQDRPVYHGIVDAMRAIARQNGVVGLYQGVVTNMCGAGLSWGIYFFLYNALNLHLQDGDSQKKLGVKAHLLTASTASLGALTLSNPIWVTKTRLFLQYEGLKADRKYSGMLDALAKIYRHEGIRGLYKGFLPGIFGISHGALLFVAYEEMKDQWNEYKHQPLDTRLNSAEYILFAALSKMYAVCLTYPYQVVRSRLQEQHRHYNGVIDVCQRIYRLEHWSGFFKGLCPCLLRVTPACCITFVVYENIITLAEKKGRNHDAGQT